MNSLPTQRPQSAERPASALLVSEGGVPYAPAGASDSLQAWAGLMEVVEALCVRWPVRPGSTHTGVFRL